MSTAAPQAAVAPQSLGRARSGALAIDVVVVCGFALALGLVRLSTPSLWVDEAFTAKAVRENLFSPIDQYHWLYYLLLKPWSLVAGDSEWALRLPSVFAAMLASGLLVVLAGKLFERRVALVSGLFLAASPFVVKWSQQARSYTLVLAAGILATLLLLRALERNSRGAWALYGLGLSLVFAMQPVSAVILVPAHLLLVRPRRASVLPHALVAPCVVVVLGVPWAFARVKQTPAWDWLPRPSPEITARTLLDVSGVAGLGVLFAVLGLVLLRRSGRGDLALWLGAWAFAPFVATWVISFVKPIYLDRYLITAAPAFAILAAVAIFAVAARWGLILAAIAVAATALGLAQGYTRGPAGWRGEGWRDAVTAVGQRHDEAQAVVVVPWWSADAAKYYGASVTSTSTADSIWVLNWSESGHDLPASVRRPLGFGDHHLVEQLDFGRRVSAQLWRRSPGR